MNNAIAWRLLFIWVTMTLALIGVQFIFYGRVDLEVLTYLIPSCTVSYLFGRQDGFHTGTSCKGEKESSSNQ